MSKMNIAFITPEYPTVEQPDGGLATYTRKVGRALVERGHGVSVFVLSDVADGVEVVEGVRVCFVRRAGVPWFVLGPLGRFSSLFEHRRSTRRLARAVWERHEVEAFDVFQVANYFSCGDGLLGNGRVPVVCRVCWYPLWWRTATKGARSFVDYLWDWLDFRQVRDADVAYAPSAFLARVYSECEGVDVGVVATPLAVGVDVEEDVLWFDEHVAGRRYLLYFGSLNGLKGVDLLAEVLPGVLRRHVDLHVVLVGRDDGLPDGSSVVELIREAVGDEGSRVVVSRPLSKALLGPVLSGARAVLMPSRFDNLPNACLEALGAGVPVIASDRSSLEEMVVDGVNGLLFANGDAGALEEAIERFLGLSAEECVAMGMAGRERAEAFLAEDRVGQLEALFEGCVYRDV